MNGKPRAPDPPGEIFWQWRDQQPDMPEEISIRLPGDRHLTFKRIVPPVPASDQCKTLYSSRAGVHPDWRRRATAAETLLGEIRADIRARHDPEPEHWDEHLDAIAAATARPDMPVFRTRSGRQVTPKEYYFNLRYACRRAGVAPFSPQQLRHLRLTEVRAARGAEAARTLGRHARLATTEIYAERVMPWRVKSPKNRVERGASRPSLRTGRGGT